MSAFIVSAGHIDYLVSAAIAANIPYGGVRWEDARIELGNADAVGAALWRENVASVAYRYADSAHAGLPGPIGGDDPDAYTLHQYVTLAPVQVLKAIDCYVYQSCEHPAWSDSEARRFCDALRRGVIGRLPGYDDAEWEIDDRGGDAMVIGPGFDPGV